MYSDAERAWESMLHLHAKLDPPLDQQMETVAGLPLTSFYALRALDSAESVLTMSELSACVPSTRSRVSRRVDELSALGLVVRASNPDDGRSSLATITSEGRNRLRAAEPIYAAFVDHEISRWANSRQLRQLADTVDAIRFGTTDHSKSSEGSS